MIFEIKGIGMPNKGAELMLIAVKDKMQEILGHEVEFSCEPTTDYIERARHSLYQKTSFPVGGYLIDWSFFSRIIPYKLRKRYGLVTTSEISILLDASGFAYGDQWGVNKISARLSNNIKKWKKNGKRIILLPQAFGPFENKAIRKEMVVILEHADLVFARDAQSLEYLDNLLPGKAILSPDFTNLVSAPAVPDAYKEYAGRPCFIPNHKMISMIKDNGGYMKNMAKCLDSILVAGERPFVLIHEGEADLCLAREIVSQVSGEVDIVIPDDALVIKSVIGQCSFVLSSRFHGLVSALSQGVPVVATGWSHKYSELLNDYGVVDFLCENTTAVDKVRLLLDRDHRSSLVIAIKAKSEVEKQKSELMWERVNKCIAGN